MSENFDLENFLPYRLFTASELVSQSFRNIYKREYQMSRSEWRVLAHLGQYGDQTATDIGRRAHLHKTKVSRAVFTLEKRRWLKRKTDEADRRSHLLTLTPAGQKAFEKLGRLGNELNNKITKRLGERKTKSFLKMLQELESHANP